MVGPLEWRIASVGLVLAALGCGSVELGAGDATTTGDALATPDGLSFSDTPGPGLDGTPGDADGIHEDGSPILEEIASEDVDGAEETAVADDAEEAEDVANGDAVADGSEEDTTGTEDAGGEDVTTASSRCAITDDEIACTYETLTLDVVVGFVTESRDVLYQVPLTPPPAKGYPVAIAFHGTAISPENFWSGYEGGPGGLWYQVGSVKALLDAGYAVLTPRAEIALGYWNSNVPPMSFSWSTAPDNALMIDLIAAIGDGAFGPLDKDRLYPLGISSGGYMASRVALTYAGVRAAAIHSASYMTCGGAACSVPELEPGHPPTVFLHGELDGVVPMWTMELYRDALIAAEVATATVTDPAASHAWIAAAPDAITAFFAEHP